MGEPVIAHSFVGRFKISNLIMGVGNVGQCCRPSPRLHLTCSQGSFYGSLNSSVDFTIEIGFQFAAKFFEDTRFVKRHKLYIDTEVVYALKTLSSAICFMVSFFSFSFILFRKFPSDFR